MQRHDTIPSVLIRTAAVNIASWSLPDIFCPTAVQLQSSLQSPHICRASINPFPEWESLALVAVQVVNIRVAINAIIINRLIKYERPDFSFCKYNLHAPMIINKFRFWFCDSRLLFFFRNCPPSLLE